MTTSIDAIPSQAHAALALAENGGPKSPKGAASLHQMAKEFETMLVHQLLDAAKVGGDANASGTSAYRGMAVDAFANGVSQAGGLGLAKQIEDALTRGRGPQ
jgi:Rod binding domain-containing protein